jgi:hypothetical protein
MLWVYEQPSAYYRRHLVLHEGVHGFCQSILGSCGPPWYMEGVAELLATHRWQDGRLTMNIVPANKEEAPMWGRIKIIKDAVAAGRPLTMDDILAYGPTAHREVEAYGWCWAAAVFLDHHPRYQAPFREISAYTRDRDFTARFGRMIGDDWPQLAGEWRVFVHELEYGHDVARTALDLAPGKPLSPGGATRTVAADRGWQSSGLRLEAGTRYRLRASGRYQVANRPRVWWCEPNGVSIRYYKGLPLGILLAAVVPDTMSPDATDALVHPTPVGLDAVFTPDRSGTLMLRINDSAGELGDNAGELSVDIRPEPAVQQ